MSDPSRPVGPREERGEGRELMTVIQGWPFLLYAGLVVTVVVAMLLLSHLLGERHAAREMGEPYESGIPPTGTARSPYSAQFYLTAVFFVVFDLEAAFLFAWAVAATEVGWWGLAEAVVFVGVLLAALAYLWRDGALDWGTPFGLTPGTGEGSGRGKVGTGGGEEPWTGG